MNTLNGDAIAGDGYGRFFDTKTKANANSRLIRLEEFKQVSARSSFECT